MCGIVGIAGALAYKDEATMKRLFLLDYFRGPDSTGLAAIRNDGSLRIAKVPSNPLDLFDMGRFKDALNGTMSTVFIGHNRAATKGVINHYNAHPYEFEHIVGVHNGTLDYSGVKALDDALEEKYPVDSQSIIAAIAKLGVDATIPLIQGAWSIVYYNMKDKTLNFIRNKERPMWYAFTKDLDKIFYASEWEMIDAAVKLSKGYELYADKEGFKFWSTEEDVHYSFNIDELKKGGKERPKPLAHALKGKEPAPAATGGYDPFNRGVNHGGGTNVVPWKGLNQNIRTGQTSATKPLSLVHIFGDDDEPLGGCVDKARFEELAKWGCSWCREEVKWPQDVKGSVIFERDDTLICPTCAHAALPPGPSRIVVKPEILARYE